MKRFSYLLIIIALIAVIIFVGYFLRYRAEEPAEVGIGSVQTGGLPTTPTQQTQPPAGGTAGSGQDGQTIQQNQAVVGTELKGEVKFGIVAQNPVANFYVDEDNNAILVQPDGQIVKISRGEASILSSSAIKNLARAEFSYDGKKILASFGERNNLQHSIFNVEEKAWQPLLAEQKIESVSWSPSSYELVYIKSGANGAKTIAKLDPSLKSPKEQIVLSMHAEDLAISWINKEGLILSERGSALFPSSVWLLNSKTKELIPLVENKLGASSLWDGESGTGLVFSTDLSRRGGNLELIDFMGNQLAKLSALTVPQKCAFNSEKAADATSTAENYLYCGIPKDDGTMKRNRLPDDYEKMAFFTADSIYKINISNGEIKKLPHGEGAEFDAENLKVFNGTLFFVNRLDGKLYAMALK